MRSTVSSHLDFVLNSLHKPLMPKDVLEGWTHFRVDLQAPHHQIDAVCVCSDETEVEIEKQSKQFKLVLFKVIRLCVFYSFIIHVKFLHRLASRHVRTSVQVRKIKVLVCIKGVYSTVQVIQHDTQTPDGSRNAHIPVVNQNLRRYQNIRA